MQQEYPLVSIVTPSLNQGRFIEETILSIKNQSYPNIEHIIVDGGSTDNTLDIIKKYVGSYNMQWISEPDEGQSDAINKGWRISKGEIIAYLNSDDTYMPWAVDTAVKFLIEHPDVAMVYGDCNIIDDRSVVVGQCRTTEFDLGKMLCGLHGIPQPATFLRISVIDKIGYLNTNLHYAMDYDYWIRIGLKLKICSIPQVIANFRMYSGSKSVSEKEKILDDLLYILNKFFVDPALPPKIKAVKQQAYSRLHLKIGLHYRSKRQMGQTRKHLLNAILRYPPILMRTFVIGYLVTSLLGERVTNLSISLKRTLIDKI